MRKFENLLIIFIAIIFILGLFSFYNFKRAEYNKLIIERLVTVNEVCIEAIGAVQDRVDRMEERYKNVIEEENKYQLL